jgi:hypothetical protein
MDFKKNVPHLIAVIALMLVSAVYFSPNAFNGKVLPQPDNDKARAMQTEIKEYQAKEGKSPLWTNSAFGGMPSYQIYAPVKGNMTVPIYKSIFLWADYTSIWAQVFAAMLCMYILLIVLGADWRIGIFGALAFGITSYNIDLLEAGHSTKMAALALAPGVFAGVVLAFGGNLLLGGSLAAIFLAMQLYANHIQITYYTLLITGIYILIRLIDSFRHKNFISWGTATGTLALAILIGFGSNLSRIWPTYEYSQETIRGKSELSSKAGQNGGLNRDYQFGWSYGIGESLTLLVPHAYGGGATESIKGTSFFDMVSRGAPPNQMDQIAQQTASAYYWGEQPFVGTAIYYGAIICFLFLFGAIVVPGSMKWWLTSAAAFSVMLAWGGNFFLNDVFNSILPMFNKFRAVSMALGLGQLFFAALAAMGLQKLFDQDIPVEKKRRALMISAGVTVVLCLIAGFSGGGVGPNDARLAEQIKLPNLSDVLVSDRSALARSDAFRSIGFIALAAGLIWFALQGRLKAGITVIAITVLALADHWTVCNRSLSESKYENKRTAIAVPKEEDYDKQIKQDKDLSYRVLDMARGPITQNWTTSYFHKSLSGYHAAKLQRFQEVVDTFLGVDLAKNLHIIGMMNGKYLVTPKGEIYPNEKVCGNAWFVKNYNIAPTADAEFHALGSLNPKETAVIQQAEATTLQGFTIQPDTTATIRLSAYHPDKMEYEYSAKTEQLAVFSEMYYPPSKGWKCYLNGQPAPDFIKADYLLRAMRLPAGDKMKLEMRFEPRSYYLGEKVAFGASLLTILLFLGGLFFYFRKHKPEDPNKLTDFESETPRTQTRASATAAPPAKKGGVKKK